MAQIRYAEVNTETNIVRNVFYSEPDTLVRLPGHSYVEVSASLVVASGFSYDPVSGEFTPPPVITEPLTRAEFIRRLGPSNLFAIKSAALRPDEVGMQMDYFVELTRLAEFIEEAEAKPALLQMEQLGVLPAGTAEQVFPS